MLLSIFIAVTQYYIMQTQTKPLAPNLEKILGDRVAKRKADIESGKVKITTYENLSEFYRVLKI